MKLLLLGIFVLISGETESSKYIPPPTVVEDSLWHDAQSGEIKPVSVAQEKADGLHRDSRWTLKPATSSKPVGATGGSATRDRLFQVFGWLILFALVGLLVFVLLKMFREVEFDINGARRGTDSLTVGGAADEQTRQRIELLPEELRKTKGNLREEAQALAEKGDFDAAIIHLFGHQLLLLDRVGWLRLARGKTNRRYARETRQHARGSAELLTRTIDAFERSYFGKHSITAEEFSALWNANVQLEREAANVQERVA